MFEEKKPFHNFWFSNFENSDQNQVFPCVRFDK